MEERWILFKVFRYNPKVDKFPHWDGFRVKVDRGTTVLDALLRIKEEDPTLAVRYSCRQSICGSCGMMINGKPRLACYTRVLSLGTDMVEVAPLKNFRIIKDLVVDFSDFFKKERSIYPFIIRSDAEEMMNPTGAYKQTEEELLKYLEFADCIECGCCYAACPTTATDPLYLGPQALNKAYRFIMDNRDEGAKLRLSVVDSDHGCWRCHFAASCSNVCPKGVDPAKAIQFLKGVIMREKVVGFKKEGTSLIKMPHCVQKEDQRSE
ncbi:MAG: succinate dehydrogenase [Thermoproteota archaeon]|nr:MAG: succinate dehydrogenase [Candidatus Korarchaeota archaeon]